MNKTQFGILNASGGLCVVLIFINLVVARLNARLNESLLQTQNQLNTAQQMQSTLQEMAVRVAQGAQTDPALIDLLKRQQLQVTLNVDGKSKLVP
jgi:hypothetical protein